MSVSIPFVLRVVWIIFAIHCARNGDGSNLGQVKVVVDCCLFYGCRFARKWRRLYRESIAARSVLAYCFAVHSRPLSFTPKIQNRRSAMSDENAI